MQPGSCIFGNAFWPHGRCRVIENSCYQTSFQPFNKKDWTNLFSKKGAKIEDKPSSSSPIRAGIYKQLFADECLDSLYIVAM